MKGSEDDRNHSCFSPHLWIKFLQVQLVFLLGPERHLDDHQESKNADYQEKREQKKKKGSCFLSVLVSVHTGGFRDKSEVSSVGRDKLTLPSFSALQWL